MRRAIILTIFAFLILVVLSGTSEAAPAGFSSYKTHNITGSPDGALTNYVINITFSNQSDTDSGSFCYLSTGIEQSLFQDIRINGSSAGVDNNVQFPIWAETASYTANSVRVWVNITDTIPQNGNYTLFIYYGNSTAANIYNGSLTFPIFDDFTGASVNRSGKDGWMFTGSMTTSISDGICTIIGPSGTRWMYTNQSTTYNVSMMARIKTPQSGFESSFIGLYYNNSNYLSITPNYANPYQYDTYSNGTAANVGISGNYNSSYHVLKISRTGTPSSRISKVYTDGVYEKNNTAQTYGWPSSAIGFGASFNNIIWVDWAALMPAVPTEPTHSTWYTPSPPVASFSSDVTSGARPLTVQFTDTTTGNPTSWEWDFGDGSPNATTQNPSHQYTTTGTYSVTLTTTNAYGSSSEKLTNYITVNPTLPDVDFSADVTSGIVGTTNIQFSGTNSVDTVDSWAWDFGDGCPNSTAQNPSHKYDAIGVYTVTLTGTNVDGSDAEQKVGYITIANMGAYGLNIFGSQANANATITPFEDNLFKDLLNYTFPKNTSDLNPEQAAYTITKPFYMYGIGTWWIIIVLFVIGAIFLFDHSGSPFLLIVMLMIGNAVIWAFIPFDWMVTIVACAIFSIALMVVSALRGRAV